MGRLLLVAALVLLPLSLSADETTPTSEGTLVVTVLGLKSSAGNVRFVLFNSKESYLKESFKSAIVEIENETCVWVAADLPHGEYALAVHHDVNGNGEMERHWYGKPKEPGGFSNDAPARFGPAKYDEARLVLDTPEKRIQVTVK